jgi:hypothetical protein
MQKQRTEFYANLNNYSNGPNDTNRITSTYLSDVKVLRQRNERGMDMVSSSK